MQNPIRRIVDRAALRVAWEVKRRSDPATRDVYAAIAELRTRHGYTALGAHELRVFSQNGEDGVLAEILARLDIDEGTFVEFGVEDGVECNTRFLAEVRGWGGRYIEPDPSNFPVLAAMYRHRSDVETLQAMVTPENVNELVPACDVLSIDVDGQDYWIWEAVDVTPAVVIVEVNAGLQGRVVEPRGVTGSGVTNQTGASIEAMRALGHRKGYALVHIDLAGVNAFFVRVEHASKFGPVTLRSPNLWLRGRGHGTGVVDHVHV